MKKILLITICLVFASGLFAQFEFDCIDRNDFYIVKTGTDINSATIKKASEIKTSNDAELQFGSNFKKERRFAETEDIYYNDIIYDNGLTLYLPEYERMYNGFHITSAYYSLILPGGQTIRVGMKLDEIKTIFPKSYSKRMVTDGKETLAIIVFFSRILNGEFQIMDSWITFIFNKGDGVLKEFYSGEPS